jgi:hypothetical protein
MLNLNAEVENEDNSALTQIKKLTVQRPGKSAKDRKSGAYARRAANAAARDAWYKDAKQGKVGAFPTHAARGNGNGAVPTKYGPGRIRSGKSCGGEGGLYGNPRKPKRGQEQEAA